MMLSFNQTCSVFFSGIKKSPRGPIVPPLGGDVDMQNKRLFFAGTFCGVFRRQALDRGAMLLGVNKVATGHNADDIAETVIMNGKIKLRRLPVVLL